VRKYKFLTQKKSWFRLLYTFILRIFSLKCKLRRFSWTACVERTLTVKLFEDWVCSSCDKVLEENLFSLFVISEVVYSLKVFFFFWLLLYLLLFYPLHLHRNHFSLNLHYYAGTFVRFSQSWIVFPHLQVPFWE